jgi:hypothetical protein
LVLISSSNGHARERDSKRRKRPRCVRCTYGYGGITIKRGYLEVHQASYSTAVIKLSSRRSFPFKLGSALGLNLTSHTVDYHANHTDSETRSDRHTSNRIITNINTRSRAQVSRFVNPNNLLHTSKTNPSQIVLPNCVHA